MKENNNLNEHEGTDLTSNKKPANGMLIVGLNLLALALYTLVIKTTVDSGGMILEAGAIIMHFSICILMSTVRQTWWWLLSALVIISIGCSTCSYVFKNINS
jgi:hypothetical protein